MERGTWQFTNKGEEKEKMGGEGKMWEKNGIVDFWEFVRNEKHFILRIALGVANVKKGYRKWKVGHKKSLNFVAKGVGW